MGRTRDQNIALAIQVAHRFQGLMHRLVGDGAVTEDEVRAYDHALRLLDREALWNLYLTTRHERNLAAVRAAESNEWRQYNLLAFLARALIATASALKGRATHFIEGYLDEGIGYAANLSRDPEAFRKVWNL